MLTINATHLTSHRDRIVGLIGADTATPVYITTRFGIHTFGLKFPIDVLVLDNQDKVVKIRERLAPNRIYIWPPVYKKVLELPSGFIQLHHIKKEAILKVNG